MIDHSFVSGLVIKLDFMLSLEQVAKWNEKVFRVLLCFPVS